MNGLGGVRKSRGFLLNSKWWTADSADRGLIGIIVLGLSQGILEDQSHDNGQK